MKDFKEKTEVELNNLNTKNLLAYYKAERKRYHQFYNSVACDCCHEIIGDKAFIEHANAANKLRLDYLKYIKSMLAHREHVKR